MATQPLVKRPLTHGETITWAASDSRRARIDSTGLITRVNFTVELVPSATLTGANQADGLNRVVRNLQLEGDGHSYFNLPDEVGCQGGTILRVLNREDGFGVGHGNGAITAPSRTFTAINFVLHAGTQPRKQGFDNPYDLSGFVPAGMVGSLNLTWSTAGNAVMDDSVTISSAVGRIHIFKVSGNVQELLGEMQRQGVWPYPRPRSGGADAPYSIMVPQWITKVAPIGGTTTDYQTVFDDLNNGGFLRRVTVLAQDATVTRPVRAGDEIVAIRIWELNQDAPIFESTAEAIQAGLQKAYNVEADDAAEDFQGGAPQGVYPIDFRSIADPVYGLNMQDTTRTIRMGYKIATNASGDTRLLLQEKLIPRGYTLAELEKAAT